jgi:hypothetical protein
MQHWLANFNFADLYRTDDMVVHACGDNNDRFVDIFVFYTHLWFVLLSGCVSFYFIFVLNLHFRGTPSLISLIQKHTIKKYNNFQNRYSYAYSALWCGQVWFTYIEDLVATNIEFAFMILFNLLTLLAIRNQNKNVGYIFLNKKAGDWILYF